jgi:hypothetical protein
MEGSGPGAERAFWLCVAASLALHALVLFGTPELHGGADIVPHLKLIQLMGEEPGLRNVYAPAFHVLGALAAPVVGLENFPKLFGLAGVLALLAAFRFFQRSARLPAESAALYALFPYLFALSWSLPKVEVFGYALLLAGLGLMLRRRHLGVALVLAVSFAVHTASALLLGFTAGVLALARADWRGIAALAVGTLGFLPLLVAHMADGCTPAQALLFSQDDYLRATTNWSSFAIMDVIVLLASPCALVLAAFGARALWRRDRPVAITCGAIVLLYLNELWLAPLATRTSMDLFRGLSALAIPVSVSAGVALAELPRLRPWLLAFCALWAGLSVVYVVPRSYHVRVVELHELDYIRVERCTFGWSGPSKHRRRIQQPAAPR